MGRLVLAVLLGAAALPSAAQQPAFAGSWLLWVESGNRGRPAYGSLVFEPTADGLAVYVEGGPGTVHQVNGDRIVFEFDWSDSLDQVHLNRMEGRLEDGVIHGVIRAEDGSDRGAWSATRVPEPDASQPPDPVDLSGIWGPPALISKHSYELTEAGRVAEEAYDPTIDDPMLRCVSDGLIRMSHGPWHIEVVDAGDQLYVLHEDLHEVRRIFLDGRSFPSGIDDAGLAMGYSVGHWEGSTLVIETRGLKPLLWDAGGPPISARAVVTERWSLDDTQRLHAEIALSDPVNYRRPLRMHLLRSRLPEGTDMRDYTCDPHGFYRGLQVEGRLEEYWGRSANRL